MSSFDNIYLNFVTGSHFKPTFMKKPLILSILLYFLSTTASNAQDTWFKIYDICEEDERPVHIVSTDEYIYLAVFGVGVLTQPATRNTIVKLTKQGDIVWSSLVPYPASSSPDIYFHYFHGFQVIDYNSIYIYSSAGNDMDLATFYLTKFNENGELSWAKSYGFEGVSVLSGFKGLSLTTDSLGLIMAGLTLPPYPDRSIAVVKTDSFGTVQLKKLIPVIPDNIGPTSTAVQMNDGSIKVVYDNNSNAYQDYFLSLDSMGNAEYELANPLTDEVSDMDRHPNGNLVYLSGESDPPMFERGGMRVQMLTPEFDTVWTRLYIDTEFPYLFIEGGDAQNLSIAPDGKILALGYNTSNCALVCYDPSGNLLWKREVVLQSPLALKFHCAEWDTDGGILLNGFIYGGFGTLANPYIEKSFLMKLDSVGCMTPGCDQTVITNINEPKDRSAGFQLSPNPTNGIFNIAPLGENFNQTVNTLISVYNNNGQLILREKRTLYNATFDLSKQAPGIYHVSVTTDNGVYYLDKLVKM
jgi:Secretion system C-terminal sorting domain